MRRRTLLGGLGGLGALAMGGLPLLSRAEADRFFLFVFCNGGWDQTRVFAPIFDGNVEMEQGVEGRSAGGIDFVHSSRRPAVCGAKDLQRVLPPVHGACEARGWEL